MYGCTQKECRDKLESLKKQAGKRLDYHRRSESLDEYLTHWLKTIKINRRIRTFDSYNGLANRHVRPHIGSIKLEDLHAEDLERWQAELVENGCSDKTRKSAIAVLRSSLNHAVKSRIVDFNPITVLTIPKADTKM